MTEIMQFDLEAGGSVLVEVSDREGGHELIARGDGLAAKAAGTLESAIGVVRPVATTVIRQFRDLSEPPDELTVEFGVRLTVTAGAVVAASTGEGHIRVLCTWRPSGA